MQSDSCALSSEDGKHSTYLWMHVFSSSFFSCAPLRFRVVGFRFRVAPVDELLIKCPISVHMYVICIVHKARPTCVLCNVDVSFLFLVVRPLRASLLFTLVVTIPLIYFELSACLCKFTRE